MTTTKITSLVSLTSTGCKKTSFTQLSVRLVSLGVGLGDSSTYGFQAETQATSLAPWTNPAVHHVWADEFELTFLGYESLAPLPAAAASAPASAPAWQDRTIASSRLRLLEYSAFMEVQRDPDTVMWGCWGVWPVIQHSAQGPSSGVLRPAG